MLPLEKVPQEQNVHGTVGYSNIETDDTEQLFLSTTRQLQLGTFQLFSDASSQNLPEVEIKGNPGTS